MNPLLVKREIDLNISADDFLEDVACLFDVLQSCYGLYEYYEDDFRKARERICRAVTAGGFAMDRAATVLAAGVLPFIQDGHFRIGFGTEEAEASCFAVRHTQLHGIPMIVCQKFWYDTEEERQQLEDFAESGGTYRKSQRLIIDVRGNPGGSDVYICEFIKGLYGCGARLPLPVCSAEFVPFPGVCGGVGSGRPAGCGAD